MKATRIIALAIATILIMSFVAQIVLFMTNSVAITLIFGWIIGLPTLVLIRLLKFVSIDYSGCDKYPTPWATTGKSIYSYYSRNNYPYNTFSTKPIPIR